MSQGIAYLSARYHTIPRQLAASAQRRLRPWIS